jgi:hypoxia up-regulated 1
MTRTFPPEPSYHLFYDLGAASLRCTLVSLKSALLPDPYSLAAKPELKNVTSVTVHGVGFDVEIGGYQFDRIVQDLLLEQVGAASGNAVDQQASRDAVKANKRAMAKLLKEAGRVKQVLSANTEAMARVSFPERRRGVREKVVAA